MKQNFHQFVVDAKDLAEATKMFQAYKRADSNVHGFTYNERYKKMAIIVKKKGR